MKDIAGQQECVGLCRILVDKKEIQSYKSKNINKNEMYKNKYKRMKNMKTDKKEKITLTF